MQDFISKQKPKPMKESELQKLVLSWFDTKLGYFVFRTYTGPIIHRNKTMSPNPQAGFPDLFGFSPKNIPFAIELKSATGKLSDKQKVWIKNLRSKGVFCLVARDLDTIQKLFGDPNDPSHFTHQQIDD